MINQQLHHSGTSVGSSKDQRGQTRSIQSVHVRSMLKKSLSHLHTVFTSSPVKRSTDLRISTEGQISTMLEEEINNLHITLTTSNLNGRAGLVIGINRSAPVDEILHHLELITHTGVGQRSITNFVDSLQLFVICTTTTAYAGRKLAQNPFKDLQVSTVGGEVDGQMTLSVTELLQQRAHRLSLLLSHVDGGQCLDIADLSL